MTLEQIWSAYRSSLRAFLHRKLPDSADAEDLLQEVLLKSYQNLGQLQKDESLQAWLFQIAQRSVADFYRQKGRGSDFDPQDLWYQEEGPLPLQELSACVAPLLENLDAESAALLKVIDLEGQSQKRLAEELGISYSTLKSRVQKARSELRGTFEACCRFDINARGELVDYKPRSGCCNDN